MRWIAVAVAVLLGGWMLGAAGGHALRRRMGARALAAAAVASLWYLPFGTALGLAELGILWRSGALSRRAEAGRLDPRPGGRSSR